MRNGFVLGIGLLLGIAVAATCLFVDTAPEQVISFVPGKQNGRVDPLYPLGRWRTPQKGTQLLVAEPGYADVLAPLGYRRLEVRAVLENHEQIPVALGVRGADGILLGRPQAAEEVREVFTMAQVTRDQDGRIGVIISAPELRVRPVPLAVRSLEFRFSDPVWAGAPWWRRFIMQL